MSKGIKYGSGYGAGLSAELALADRDSTIVKPA